MSTLQNIAKQLVAEGKGLLAADESPITIGSRFARFGIPNASEKRREWRELLFTTPEIQSSLSGIILHEETLGQSAGDDTPFVKLLQDRSIIPGVKVDQGPEPLFEGSKEEVTKGLDGLPERLQGYANAGAKFTKWRVKILVDEENGLPTEDCILRNAIRFARYAKESQEAGLVPVVEPEVLIDGTHSLATSERVLKQTLLNVFEEMRNAGVDLTGLLLKTSMALPGKESNEKVSPKEVAEATLRALKDSVPPEVPGIAFLSGGQTPEEAMQRLNAIVLNGRELGVPWELLFSYSRALQEEAMAVWKGKPENVVAAQEIFLKRVEDAAAARRGEYVG